MEKNSEVLTEAQNELYSWIRNYLNEFQHSPSIRQMMQAMGLKSPAPIQSRLKHLQEKGYISWQEGKARTMQIVEEVFDGVPQAEVAKGDIENGIDIVSLLNEKTGFLKSNGEARRALSENSISVNREKVTEESQVSSKDLINSQFILLQRGKKNYFVVKVK